MPIINQAQKENAMLVDNPRILRIQIALIDEKVNKSQADLMMLVKLRTHLKRITTLRMV